MKEKTIVVSSDISSFFHEVLIEAKESMGIDLSDSIEYYLVNLLNNFSYQKDITVPTDEPLALMYKRSLEASLFSKIKILKEMGDIALYLSGFFSDFIDASIVGRDYYISMGGNAYNNLSAIMKKKHNGEALANIYLQLSKDFFQLSDLLAKVSNRLSLHGSDSTLLKLYKRWDNAGNKNIKSILLEKGVSQNKKWGKFEN